MTKTAKRPPGRDHEALAHQYSLDVISGKVPAGGWVRKAAKRHLDDLEKSKKKTYPYEYIGDRVDAEGKRGSGYSGSRVCRFIEQLSHTKGKWAAKGEKIVLGPWQCFLVCVGFGWVRKDNGKRRFRAFYWEIPRKNGKSLLAAAIGLYMLLADDEFGAEVYSGATSEKQAWEVFKPAKLMLQKADKLREHFMAEVTAKVLIVAHKGSKFEAVIGNPGDGPSPSCAIVDEYHEHDTPALHDSMETGMGAREHPLMMVITTAGYNLASPCFDKHDELCKVLDGTVENDQLFGCIFSIDEKDEWADPNILIKANPNYGVSVDGDFLLAQQRSAMANPLQQSKFKTKHLNVWCSVLNSWMNMHLWQLATDTMLEEEEFIGDPDVKCWIGVDLASKSDLCSEQRLYRKAVNGDMHYYLFGRYWLPEEAVEEEGPNNAHYKKWVKMGLLTQTDGATVDFETLTEQIVADSKKINPVEVVYDPFNATQMAQDLIDAGVKNVVEFVQNPQNFAVPMDEVTNALKNGRFHHDGNEITKWCFANVVGRPARKGLFSPSKSKPHLKIDGAIAGIMCMARAFAPPEKPKKYQMFTVGA